MYLEWLSIFRAEFSKFIRSASGTGAEFWTFDAIYLHLHRDRVSESLWKPHKSKVLNFLHRNYTSIFFLTPKKIFFSDNKKNKIKNRFDRKWFSENRKFWSIIFFLINIFDFQKIFGTFFFELFFLCFFLLSDVFLFFFRSWKKIEV